MSSIVADCFPANLMSRITIFLLCLPQRFKAMQSNATTSLDFQSFGNIFSIKLSCCMMELQMKF